MSPVAARWRLEVESLLFGLRAAVAAKEDEGIAVSEVGGAPLARRLSGLHRLRHARLAPGDGQVALGELPDDVQHVGGVPLAVRLNRPDRFHMDESVVIVV